MNILHYLFGLPPVHKGGLPSYVEDLANAQTLQGDTALLLIPGTVHRKCPKASIRKCRWYTHIECYEIHNSLYLANEYGIREPEAFMTSVPSKIYMDFLKTYSIELLHIHSMMGVHIELVKAAKALKIPIVYTVHDYFGVCLTINLFKNNGICHNPSGENCADCSKNAYSLARMALNQTALYRWYCKHPNIMQFFHKQKQCLNSKEILDRSLYAKERDGDCSVRVAEYEQLRKYYQKIFSHINFYHYGSELARETLESYIGASKGCVIPITTRNIKDRRGIIHVENTLRFGYLGGPTFQKGFYFLIDQLDQLYGSGEKAFTLNTYFVAEPLERPYLKNHPPFANGQQEKAYLNMDVLIVPSLWKETFGLVVLEALSFGVPVLVSENVGAKELLLKYLDEKWIFKTDHRDLYQKVLKICQNPDKIRQMNQAIMECNILFDFESHVQQVNDMYNTARNIYTEV